MLTGVWSVNRDSHHRENFSSNPYSFSALAITIRPIM